MLKSNIINITLIMINIKLFLYRLAIHFDIFKAAALLHICIGDIN